MKHVTGFAEFSGEASLQSGNYLALKVDAPEGATITVEVLGGEAGPIELDENRNCVLRINNKSTQKVKVVAEKNGVRGERIYSLNGLTLKTE